MVIDSNELIEKTLGSCTLQRLIGRGGMGAVYLARQTRPRRTVAVKVLMPGMALERKGRTEFLTRFRREADAIAALDHINIMPIYEYGEQEDIAYLVMPYVTGGTLRAVIEERGILPLAEIVPIIEQAAAGLDSAHAQNIVHRDLKPGNILFHADGRVLLADFGLAKVLRDLSDEHGKKQTELTSIGTIVGTPEYLSPEQGTGKTLDYRTDVYSLGVVLYQLLTGKVPFTGSTPVAIALKHALEAPPPLTLANPDISSEVEAVVMKALAKSPEQRYTSAGELARALRSALAAEKTHRAGQIILSGASAEEKLASSVPEAPTEKASTQQAEQSEIPAQRAEPETPPQVIETLPTRIETVGLHTEQTEEAPRVLVPPALVQAPETAHNYVEQKQRPPLPVPPVERQPVLAKPARARLQPVWMMLLGSLLTLLVVGGAFFASSQLGAKRPGSALTTLHTQNGTPNVPKGKTTPKATVTLPGPLIAAGQQIYGTDQPGANCDKRGAEWSTTKNAQVSCTQGLTLSSTDQAMLAGTFLDKLPGIQVLPDNYIIQVQATINSGSQGRFGVFFRNQAGAQQQGTYSFLLTPPGTWSAYEYKNTTGTPMALVPGLPTQTQITKTITIDVVVRGSDYALYINGTEEGHATSGTYTSGSIGLAVDGGANVSFKNLTLYATP